MRTHIDLFSGLGGFALACKANGVRTIQFVEIDRRCRDFLAKAWPGIPIHDDIRTFSMADAGCQRGGQIKPVVGSQGRDADRRIDSTTGNLGNASGVGSTGIDGRRARQEPENGRSRFPNVWLLTGGVPCQPASRAGRQLGENDVRWLWPEAVRCLAEIRPTWALFENPPGIGDVGLARILASVEAQGYQVSVVSVGACAVGAPHRRMRYWIVAHDYAQGRGDEREKEHGIEQGASGDEPDGRSEGGRRDGQVVGLADNRCEGREGTDAESRADGLRAEHPEGELADASLGRQRIDGGAPGQCGHADERGQNSVGNSDEMRRRWRTGKSRSGRRQEYADSNGNESARCDFWSSSVLLPCADGKVRRAPDDSFGLVDGLHRSVLGALGNSVVWQVAAEIIGAMIKAEENG